MNTEIKSALEEYHQQTKDLVADVKDQLRAVEAKVNRQGLGGGAIPNSVEDAESRKAFNAYARRGDVQAALSTGADPDGGYAVPEQIDRTIDKTLLDISPVRRVCNIVPVGTSEYKKLVSVGGTVSGWVGETEARPETDTPKLAAIQPPIGEIYANPAVTQTLLDDAFFNVADWLIGEVAEEFAEKEGTAFVAGSGIKQPKGFLTYDTASTDDATRDFGTLQYLPSGVADDLPSTNPGDLMIDLVHALRAPYRQGAVWLMNSSTLARVRKFKDGNGDYLWKAGLMEGQASTLLGYPVYEVEDMPSVGANALPIAFGNFKRGYTITDHVRGTTVLRDPYTNKPFVHFYTRKRIGGGVVNSQAIKLLKIAAS